MESSQTMPDEVKKDQLQRKMALILYRAAQRGDSRVFRDKENQNQLHVQLTPCNNSLIHVLAQFDDYEECINIILESLTHEVKRSLLICTNSKGEIALHIAARMGRLNIVKRLLEHAKAVDIEEGNYNETPVTMMRSIDQNGDTALHEAVRNKHDEVAKVLVQGDRYVAHIANLIHETPLYIAIESCGDELVNLMLLKAYPEVSYGGPGGKNALHAAVIRNSKVFTKELLDHDQRLIREVDEFGWSPLHYAARFNFVDRTKQLLEANTSVAYIVAHNDDRKTPLHIAACEGMVEVMKVLLDYCPDCWEMTTYRRQNILHLAVDYEKEKVLEFIVTENAWAANLINEKDVDGNTPLHLYAKSNLLHAPILLHKDLRANANAFNWLNLTPLEVRENLQYYTVWKDVTGKHLKENGGMKGYRNVVQHDHEIFRKWKNNIRHEEKKLPVDIRKHGDSQLIVAALIATVTFAAGFTVPGGYNNGDDDFEQGIEKGGAVFARKTAFRAFVLTDVIALLSSVIAILFYLAATMYTDRRKVTVRYDFAGILVIVSIISMLAAFVTGLYTVLESSSPGLAITVCFFGSIAAPIVCFILYSAIANDLTKWNKKSE